MLGVWDDHNRFHQHINFSDTVFPKERDYKNKFLFLEDMRLAEERELAQQLMIERQVAEYEEKLL